MTAESMPPLVVAIEAALGTRVLSVRYLPSPTAAAAALAEAVSTDPEDPGLGTADADGRSLHAR